jgi:hypothetical protein
MADRVLFIGWNEPVRGREELAVESFNEMVGFLGRCQQEGRIERLDAVFLTPTGSGLQGYMQCECTTDQLNAMMSDQEFLRRFTEAGLVVDGLQLNSGWCNEGVASQMEMYNEAVSKVPQIAG